MRLRLLCEDPYVILDKPYEIDYPNTNTTVKIDVIDHRFEDWPIHQRLGLTDQLFERARKPISWQAPLPGGLWLYRAAGERGVILSQRVPHVLRVPPEWVEWSVWMDGNDVVKQARKLRDTELINSPTR